MSDKLFEDDLEASEAFQRCVYVDTKKEFGTGIVAGTGLVITTLHFVDKGKVQVDKNDAKLIHSNRRQDLAALAAPTRKLPPLMVLETARRGQNVYYLGFIKKRRQIMYKGEVTFFDSQTICASCITEKGTCGAGLWSDSGLIGILATDEDVTACIAVPGKILKRFVSQSFKRLKSLERGKVLDVVKTAYQIYLPYSSVQTKLNWD